MGAPYSPTGVRPLLSETLEQAIADRSTQYNHDHGDRGADRASSLGANGGGKCGKVHNGTPLKTA